MVRLLPSPQPEAPGKPTARCHVVGEPQGIQTHPREWRQPAIVRWRVAASVAACVALVATGGGCGTVFYGRTQTIALRSSPSGARASLGDRQTTTPDEVKLLRNQPGGWAVFRAEAPGYEPACMVVRGRYRTAFLVMDGLFLGLPMLVDLVGMGSLNALRRYPDTVSLTLRPLEPEEKPQPLPSDREVIHFRRLTWVDLCQPNGLRIASVAATGCDERTMRIEAADGNATKVWWTYYCGERRFDCSSDRRFDKVSCRNSGP